MTNKHFVQRPGIQNVVGPAFQLLRGGVLQALMRLAIQRAKAAEKLTLQHVLFPLLHTLLYAFIE